MMGLELRFLGELEVVRDEKVLALPPSRKTRALLAYLVLSGRPSRRDHLCELLWELPDDPRGSLRWSLSKLRRLVDEEACVRIIADRNQASFDSKDVAIDVVSLRDFVEQDLADASIECHRAHFSSVRSTLNSANASRYERNCSGSESTIKPSKSNITHSSAIKNSNQRHDDSE